MRYLRAQKGFSLVETLVAISILIIAVLAPMRIASQGIKSAAFVREQLTAVFLVQEGIESIIRLRDEDRLDGGDTWDWYSSLPSACKNSTGCGYDVADDSFVACTGSRCVLHFDENGDEEGYYSYSGDSSSESIYTRVTTIEEVRTGEVTITSTVSWTAGVVGDTVNVSAQTQILDVYE